MSTTLKRITILILASFGISILAVLLRASYFTITFQVLIFAVAFIWLFAWLVYSADSTGRSLLWTGVAFVLFVPYLLATAAGASHAINSLRLERFAAQFLDNSPANSKVSLAQSQVGVLTGNGNHCDFIVDIRIASNLSHDEIAAYYAAFPVRRAVAGESSEVRLVFEEVDDGIVMLNATDAPNGSALDFRCI